MIPVLIIGKSGSGKSASLRNLDPARVGLVNVLGKPLPFKGKFKQVCTDDYDRIAKVLQGAQSDIVVIDDAGYLITNMFMRGHGNAGRGNGVFSLYNDLGDRFWGLINAINALPSPARVYMLMHEDKSDSGEVKPKTIGKLLDEKVCVEGMFSICLHCMLQNGKHVFRTQSDGLDVAKSPMGMFEDFEIDNDLAYVDQKICEYYEIGGEKQ